MLILQVLGRTGLPPPPHLGLFLTEISDLASESSVVTRCFKFLLYVLAQWSHVFLRTWTTSSRLYILLSLCCLQRSLSYFCDNNFRTVLLCLSLPVLAVTIFTPTPSWCRKICLCFWHLQEQNLVSLSFVLFSIIFLFYCLYLFPLSDIRCTLLLFL